MVESSIIQQKQCNTCLETKPISSFYKSKGCRDGHINYCKSCHADRYREKKRAYKKTEKGKACEKACKSRYQKRYPEKAYARNARYRSTEKGRSLISKTYKRYSDELTDAHVRTQVKRQTGLSVSEITPELIELKRQLILSKRTIKDIENDKQK